MEPGWYPDPDDSNARRYWDGNGWSAPLPLEASSRNAAEQSTGSASQPASDPTAVDVRLFDDPTSDVAVAEPPQSRGWFATHRLLVGFAAAVVLALGVTIYVASSGGSSDPSASSASAGSPKSESDTSAASEIDTAHGACTVEVLAGTDSWINEGSADSFIQAVGVQSPVFSIISDQTYSAFVSAQARNGQAAGERAAVASADAACTTQGDPVLDANQLQSVIAIATGTDQTTLQSVTYTG